MNLNTSLLNKSLYYPKYFFDHIVRAVPTSQKSEMKL